MVTGRHQLLVIIIYIYIYYMYYICLWDLCLSLAIFGDLHAYHTYAHMLGPK